MGNQDLVQLAKDLKLCDERELFAKVVVSYSNMTKALNIAFANMQGAGSDGFVGIYQDQLVCFTANTLGTKPKDERFRMSFEFIRTHEIKKGFLGLSNVFLITTEQDMFKLYFMGKRKPMIEKINQTIKG